MQIISATTLVMASDIPVAWPLPAALQSTAGPADSLIVTNLGPSTTFVTVGANGGVRASADDDVSTQVPPSNSNLTPGSQVNPTSAGPTQVISITTGQAFFSAVTNTTLVVVCSSTATGSLGSTSITVATTAGIQEGQIISSYNGAFASGTTVTGISGTTLTISQATTAALSGDYVQFSITQNLPSLIAVALGISTQ